MLLGFGAYFLAAPVLEWPLPTSSRYSLAELDQYYSIVGASGAVVSGIAALGLGLMYYRHRLGWEHREAKADRIRQRLTYLLDQLDAYADYVDMIFSRTVESSAELHRLRRRIERRFENISMLIEQNDKLLGLDESDIGGITRVHSTVEKSPVMQMGLEELKIANLDDVYEEYMDRIHSAKLVCFAHFE